TTLQEICDVVTRRHARGRSFSIVVVAEGAQVTDHDGSPLFVPGEKRDAFGHVRLGGIAPTIAERVEAVTGFESRYTVLGHIQRGGSPTAFDRVLGSRFGVAAVDLVARKGYGRMVAIRGTQIVDLPLAEAVGTIKIVGPEFYETARVFFS
ncbi:MAG TPA: 6-phosphofructokinase, partial [Candidatus Eisenbacteria bacterium]|nr:6-phosphofructokinase [Candidatus Eisenbacteria bacterium]